MESSVIFTSDVSSLGSQTRPGGSLQSGNCGGDRTYQVNASE